jgi:glutamine synthetase
MSPQDVLKLVKDREVKFVDFRFTDTRGKEQHVGVPVKHFGAGQIRVRPRLRRLVDRRLEGHPGLRHAAHAGSGHRGVDPFMDETTLVIPATWSSRPTARATTAIRARSPSAPRRI